MKDALRIDTFVKRQQTSSSGSCQTLMNHEPRNRQRSRWIPEVEPDRRGLQTLFAFAYGMQVGRMRRIAAELQKLAQQAQLATMASGAAIAIAAQNQIECIARSGGAAPQLGSKPEATVGLSGECIRTGIPQFCADTETHPFVDRMHSRTFGVRSIVYVPLFRGVQPAGVIGVFSDKPGHFTQHDMRVLQLIGREVTKALKWEPNPHPVFPATSAVVVPPEPAALAAAAEIPEPAPATPSEAIEQPTAFVSINHESAAETSHDDQHEDAIVKKAEAILKASETTANELQQVSEDAALPEVAEAEAVSQSTPAEGAKPEMPLEWVSPEDLEYPASVPSFLFGEDRAFPRWVTFLAVIASIVVVFGAIWWFMPLWSPKEDSSQMVYGPPQVTRDAATASPEQSQGAPAESAAIPGVAKPDQSPSKQLVPGTFVKTVKTQITGTHTFVSVYLSGPAQFQAHELINPDRIYIDLHDVEISPEMKNARIAGVGPVAEFRFSQSEANIVRLVMVLDAPCTYLVSVTSDPYVIVFDVQPLRMPRPGAKKRKTPDQSGF
jgi:hypothetical protein